MSTWKEHVHPHGDLVELAEGLWTVTGSLPRSGLPRNMVLYRLRDGGLLIHSAVALDDRRLKELEGLGPPWILVVPNSMHRADAAVWRQRFPEMTVCCPPAARQAVSKVVEVDEIDADLLAEEGITCHGPTGEWEHVYELPLVSGVALCCTDLLFNIEEHLPGVAGFIAQHVTASTGFFGVTRLGRLFMWARPMPFEDGWRSRASGMTSA